MYGLTDDEVSAIREGKLEGFVPAEMALLRMADAMSDAPANVSDGCMPNCASISPRSNSWNWRQTRRWKIIEPGSIGSLTLEVTDSIEKDCSSNRGGARTETIIVSRGVISSFELPISMWKMDTQSVANPVVQEEGASFDFPISNSRFPCEGCSIFFR